MEAKRRSAGAEGHYLKWMLALMVIAILLALLVPGVSAEWYRREVTINNGDSALTDYQVLVELTDYTHIDSNGDSIRFTNIANDQKYDYWIEDWDPPGTSKIWVEVPEVPNGDSKMYLWSNAGGASPDSNGDATFQFFDGFSGSAIDTSKWTKTPAVGAGWSVTGVELKGTKAEGRLTSTSPFSDGVILEIKSRYITLPEGTNAGYQTGGFFSSTSNAFGFLNHDTPDYYYRNNVLPWVKLATKVPASTNQLTKISVKSTSSVDLSVTNYDSPYNNYHSVSNVANEVSGEPIALGRRYDNEIASIPSYIAYWDWIRVRKYASTEPTITDMGTPSSTGENPVPELQTVILFSVGLLVLAGYVLLRRREKKKGE